LRRKKYNFSLHLDFWCFNRLHMWIYVLMMKKN